MLISSRADALRFSLMGVLGASLVACGGTADTSPAEGSGNGSGSGSGASTAAGGGGTLGNSGGSGGLGQPGTGGASAGGSASGGAPITGKIPDCTNPQPLAGGFVQCDEGYTHRETEGSCPTEVPRAEKISDATLCPMTGSCSCDYDGDCGANQYCALVNGQVQGYHCQAGCKTDNDCTTGSICECTGGVMGRCVASEDCTTDADCAGEARCADSSIENGCGALVTYVCQTPMDQCASNAECGAGKECVVSAGVRTCKDQMLTCAAGRPFIVESEIRVAPICERIDWLVESSPDLTGLSVHDRQALGIHWQEAAQMEHASIAAFARFSLQLLALGAPATLIEQTNQALVDETAHARACFALATAYQGKNVGPQPLNINDVLGDNSLESIVRTAIVEGCIGETVAALEAGEAAAQSQDPHVAGVLRKISAEESRHAELAWSFLRWVVSEHASLLPLIKEQFALAVASAQDVSVIAPSEKLSSSGQRDLSAYGMLSSSSRREVYRSACLQVVGPCAQRLFVEATGAQKETFRAQEAASAPMGA